VLTRPQLGLADSVAQLKAAWLPPCRPPHAGGAARHAEQHRNGPMKTPREGDGGDTVQVTPFKHRWKQRSRFRGTSLLSFCAGQFFLDHLYIQTTAANRLKASCSFRAPATSSTGLGVDPMYRSPTAEQPVMSTGLLATSRSPWEANPTRRSAFMTLGRSRDPRRPIHGCGCSP